MSNLSIEDFEVKLTEYLCQVTDSAVKIDALIPLAGGASRDSWRIDARIDGQPTRYVMRRDLPTSMSDSALSRAQEFRVMAAAYDHGVRVAKVRYLCEDPAVLGLPFFIMDFVEGISIGRKVIQDAGLAGARAVLPEQMAEQLARIHTLNADPLDFLPRSPVDQSPARIFVRRAYDMLDALGVKSPAFEFLLRWADQHAPDAPAITFVHGDFRVGNLLVDSGGLAAVIDWEFAHIGDPREELGYLCMRDWRFGADHLHAGGLAPRERLLRAYETASGRTIDRAAVDWWEIAGNIFWGITCLAQADRHLSGRDPSVELASLGRRSVEMQMEALRLIGKVGI